MTKMGCEKTISYIMWQEILCQRDEFLPWSHFHAVNNYFRSF